MKNTRRDSGIFLLSLLSLFSPKFSLYNLLNGSFGDLFVLARFVRVESLSENRIRAASGCEPAGPRCAVSAYLKIRLLRTPCPPGSRSFSPIQAGFRIGSKYPVNSYRELLRKNTNYELQN